MPLTLGGLGIGRGRWAVFLEMIQNRHPDVDTMSSWPPALRSVCRSGGRSSSVAKGRGQHPKLGSIGIWRDPTEPLHRWQKEASSKVHKNHREKVVWPLLTAGERASVRSQGGPLASVPFTSFPVSGDTGGFSSVPGPPLETSSFAVAPLCPFMLLWPSTRRSWPPQGSLWQGRSSWQTWFRGGECYGADLQRSGRQGVH